MGKQYNILSYLIDSENRTTEMLYALLAYKPFRELVVRLFTESKFGADDISWDDIEIQSRIGNIIPDMALRNDKVSILVEVKIDCYRGLMDSQPGSYLKWLAGPKANGSSIFVALVPPDYKYLEELDRRINDFQSSNSNSSVRTLVVKWDQLIQVVLENDLEKLNQYIRDFCSLLKAWYEVPVIKFTTEETRLMYDKKNAVSIRKLLETIEEVIDVLKEKGYEVKNSFSRRWWQDGEYGCYIKRKGNYILFFGLWQDYWEKFGQPLCYGVAEEWDSSVCEEFRKAHPSHEKYEAYLMKNIDQLTLLSERPVFSITKTIEKEIETLSRQP
ncbi:MAG: hypothetical protein Q3M30_14910 [Candidatus Electrothrix sp. Rat3]|nr:hypothetical protein [Candidatus Electrothrix rattekaaiensis]